MGAETLHIVSEELIEELCRGISGGRADWSEFYRQNRLKGAVLRAQGLDFSSSTRRPFNLSPEENSSVVMNLLELYGSERGLVGSLKEWMFPLGHKHLGLREAVRSLRDLYLRDELTALELDFGYVLAQLAHLSLPTWCPRRIGLSFLFRMGWTVLEEAASNPVNNLPIEPKQDPHPIATAYSAGIFLDPDGVRRIEKALNGPERQDLVRLGAAKQVPASELDPALELLSEAFGFARQSGCGLIEATGILDEDSMITSV